MLIKLYLIILLVQLLVDGAPHSLPTFYIDPTIENYLIGNRIECLRGFDKERSSSSSISLARHELSILKRESATEYYRGHELYAHDFFVEMGHANTLRVYNYSEAEFEYIPILPMHWLVKNPKIENNQPQCGYKELITRILKAQTYLEKRDRQYATLQSAAEASIKPKFSVASTFNLRTELGTGMPTQVRKGDAWEKVMRFITSLSIGHYERWPQCPDLLRKSPRLNIELPYVTTSGGDDAVVMGSDAHNIKVSDRDHAISKKFPRPKPSHQPKQRKITFFFSGNFALFGPEMVCSVRNAVLNVSERADLVILNSTITRAHKPLQMDRIERFASRSMFCIVTKGDSYSTSFFYLALQHGCIPLVISDWFTFAFPWIVKYETFVLRVLEADFLINPMFVLDYIRDNIGSKLELVQQMQENMEKYLPLLSFNRVQQGSLYHKNLLSYDQYLKPHDPTSSISSIISTSMRNTKDKEYSSSYTYVPMELLLLELRYSQRPHQYYNSVPCLRPYMCSDNHLPNRSYVDQVTEYIFPVKNNVKKIDVLYRASTGNGGDEGKPTVGYSVVNDGYQVKGIDFPIAILDIRTHLCRHNSRLIGSYKIVFFMQCVRILWPLQPGTFKPVDNIQRFTSPDPVEGVIARYRGGRFPIEPNGISREDMQFVRMFHNATKPVGYVLTNYPIHSDALDNVIPF